MTVQTTSPTPGVARAHEVAKAGESPGIRLDRIDRRILLELQADATLPVARLADRVGLSQTPCWKRVQRLEQAGVIVGRVALVDPRHVGLGLTAFMSVSVADHSPALREAFAGGVAAMPEVVEVWRITGQADFLLKVAVRDLEAFDAFYQRLTTTFELKAVSSQLALERVAHTTALPIDVEAP